MILKLLAAAAALALPVSAALAGEAVPAASGALAGRSPVHAHRAAVAAARPCGTAMHSQPAGKPAVYGTHALPAAACAPSRLASAERRPAVTRD